MRSQHSKIAVLLADDHRIVRERLRVLLSTHDDIEVVGEAEDGVQALELARRLAPDVLVLDVSMPKMSGFQVLRNVVNWPEAPAVVICSMHEEVLPSATALGASAFVEKRAAATMLVEAVRNVASESHSLRA